MKIYKKSIESGQASFVLILLIGLVAIMSVLASSTVSTSNVQVETVISQTNQARYAAWAGIDEMMYRLRSKQVFGASYSLSLAFANGATVSANISGNSIQKVVKATGFAKGTEKNIEILVATSSSKASFVFAAQSGLGGFEMENGSQVIGANNTDGNVYSNGDVLGTSSSAGTNGAKIMGGVWATGTIGGLSSLDSGGVYVLKNAWASSLKACTVVGAVKALTPPTNCSYGGSFTISDPPASASLASVDIDYWKNLAQSGTVWNGNCVVKSGKATDCTNGTGTLGNIKINGGLTSANGETITISGPVWVKGNIEFANLVKVKTAESAGTNSVVVVASDPDNNQVNGKIQMNNNVVFNRNSQGAGIILISENTSTICSDPAITLSNNATSVVLIALNGCIYIRENAEVSGVIGYKVHLTQNAKINYEPSLARAIAVPDTGGWSVVNVKEY